MLGLYRTGYSLLRSASVNRMSPESTSSEYSAELHAKSVEPRIVFMGTPEFAVPSLKALVDNGLRPIAVVTGPDKKRGRGQILSPTAVKMAALEAGIATILQPEDVRDPQFALDIEAQIEKKEKKTP